MEVKTASGGLVRTQMNKNGKYFPAQMHRGDKSRCLQECLRVKGDGVSRLEMKILSRACAPTSKTKNILIPTLRFHFFSESAVCFHSDTLLSTQFGTREA